MTFRYDMTFREVCELLDQKDAEIQELKAEVEKYKKAIRVLAGEPEEESQEQTEYVYSPEAYDDYDEVPQEKIDAFNKKIFQRYPEINDLSWSSLDSLKKKDIQTIVNFMNNTF